MPSFGHLRSGQQKVCFFFAGAVPVHSAHVGSVYRVQYRWHAYFGADVKVYRSYQRGDGTYVGIERDLGVAVMAPAWVLDAEVVADFRTNR